MLMVVYFVPSFCSIFRNGFTYPLATIRNRIFSVRKTFYVEK